MGVHVYAYCRQVCVCMCIRYRLCVYVHKCARACVLILRAGAETPVFAPAAFPHQCLYWVGSRGKGRGPSSVQLRVLNEGSSVASAEDICRCRTQPTWPLGRRRTTYPGSWDSVETSSQAGHAPLPQEVLPGSDSVFDSVLLLDTLGGASVVKLKLGAVKAAAPSNFWHLGTAPH